MASSKVAQFFKDTQGRYRTQSLFHECDVPAHIRDAYPAIFTLGETDRPGRDGSNLISMRRVFIELRDPTGYMVARQLLGSWAHWLKLCKLPWFKAHLDEWRSELDVLLRSSGIHSMKEAMDGGSEQAARWFAEQKWKHSPPKRRGRPPRDRDIPAPSAKDTDDDAARIGI